MQLSSGKNSGPLLATALVLALLFAVYYYVVLPKQDEAETKQSNVDNLNSEISTLKEQIALVEAENNSAVGNEFAIRKKLPESREIDQLLLSLEEIEYVSNSRIVGVSFNNYDDLVSASGLGEAEEEMQTDGTTGEIPVDGTTDGSVTGETVDGTTDANVTDGAVDDTTGDSVSDESADTEQEETVPVSTMSAEALPTNLKLITFQIDIESPDDERLQQFIKEIEQLERVMHIDTIEYSLPGEEDAFSEEASTIVSASIQVTTFYFE